MMRADALHAAWRALPQAADERLLTSSRPMILAPHADDETLGCGGLIAELCARGRPPLVVIVTDGTGSHPNSATWPPSRLRALREHEARAATAVLGLPDPCLGFLRLRDTAAPREGDAFEAACRAIALRASACDTLLAPWLGDPHCDHEAVQLMARRVADGLGARLLSYPVWGWLIEGATSVDETPPVAGFSLDITRHLPRKAAAIRLHASQYTNMIDDDPSGFRLPEALLSVFEQPRETYLEAR
ncbi:PIG-L deacetylase family protein [Lichenicoccus sp.]|uniref:PIG-L deacetylase family protein n=1 Tax=Lichenicoccus sp. TaxID=2781899 RepID=UPI003D0CB790